MYLYIIRHGETYGNLNGDGFTETDLTDNGLNQAFLLGERFKDEKIDAIYTSPLIRAVRTGSEIHKYHKNAKFNIFTSLMEKGTDKNYTGLPDDVLENIVPQAVIRDRTPLGEEDQQKAMERATAIINTIISENTDDSNIVIVAHGMFNTYLILAATGLALIPDFNFSQNNTGVTLIRYLYEDNIKKTKLTYLNDCSHLF
jgi:probable phosphoglycerate mutase